MTRFIVVCACLLIVCSIGGAWADGILAGPSEVLRHFAEQTQAAVVEVKPDRTVAVDLFISLMDTSGQPHTIYHLLPLQTLPGKFSVDEQTLEDFRKQELAPVDRILLSSALRRRAARESVASAYLMGAVLGGPAAPVVPFLSRLLDGGRGGDSLGLAGVRSASSGPVATVQTAHSRADVYPKLKPDEIAALASAASLPPAVNRTLRQYAGRPFALLRLKTIPRQTAPDDKQHRRPRAPQPGLHLQFTQSMVKTGEAYVYDYPLGTGQGWANPIPLTQVYVTAPEAMPLQVKYPGRKLWIVDAADRAHRGRGSAWAGAADGRQAYFAAYYDSNEKRDIAIRLRDRRVSEFVGIRRVTTTTLALAWGIFPVFGLCLWMVVLGALLRHDERAQEIGFLGALWRGWLGGVAIAVPAAIAFFVGLLLGPRSGLGGEIGNATLLTVAAIASITFILPKVLPQRTQALMWKAIAASVIAAVLYDVFGSMLLAAFRHLLMARG